MEPLASSAPGGSPISPVPHGREPRPADPTIAATFRLGRRVWDARAELRGLYASIENPEFWQWLMWFGAAEVPDFERTFFPVPDAFLVERIMGEGGTADDFVKSGIVDARAVYNCLSAAGLRFDGESILDFGCGCGRTLRNLSRFGDACRFTGVDPDAEAIDWCSRHLTFAEFQRIPRQPPSALRARAFDAAYSVSVFTQLPEQLAARCLAELARVLRPGALLAVSLHGARVVERWLAGHAPSTIPMPTALADALPGLRRNGYLFFRFPYLGSRHRENQEYWGDFDLDLYGNAFVTRAHVEARWTRDFELVRYWEAPEDWQDFAVLRRR